MTDSHPIHLLPELIAELKLNEPDGAPQGAPIPRSYREAVEWLARRNYLRSARYRAQCWNADLSGLHPDLVEFLTLFMRAAANVGIPIHCEMGYISRAVQARRYVLGESQHKPGTDPFGSGRRISVVHSCRMHDVPPIAWRVLAHIGNETIAKAGLAIEWAGPAAPSQWVCAEAG